MPRLRIPDEHKSRLVAIAKFSDEDFQALTQALASAHPSLLPAVLAESIFGKVGAVNAKQLTDVVDTLVSLYRARAALGFEHDDFLTDVDDFIRTDKAFADVDPAMLHARITKLMSLDETVGVTSKAIEVSTEHQHVYCDARILTDVRPVFASNPEQEPHQAVVIHTLRLGYHESGRHQEFFVALDPYDLANLGEVIERAEQKEEAIRSMLGNCNVHIIGMEAES